MKQYKTLFITIGIPGSGKSSWAREYINKEPTTRIRFNNDDIRNMLGVYWVPEREDLVNTIKHDIVSNAMYKNYDIVIDNMNLNPKEREYWEQLVTEFNQNLPENTLPYKIEYKYFIDVSVEECIRRDAKRINPIGEKVIRDIWKKYRHWITTTKAKLAYEKIKKTDYNKTSCIIIDVDNTLCFNTTGRPWFDSGKQVLEDKPNPATLRILFEFMYKVKLIIVSGRKESEMQYTDEWLKRNNIVVDGFYLRKDNDFRKGYEVKKELVEKVMQTYNILFSLEDDPEVVQMYRDMGIVVLQPN